MKNYTLIFCFIIIIPFRAETQTGTFIPANDSGYAYIGRFDLTDKQTAVFMYSGCTIRTCFDGSSVEMVMNDDSLRNQFTIIIDQSLSVLKTDKKEGHYLLAKNLPDGKHTLEIIRRTEWHGGNSRFLGLNLDMGRKIYKPEIKQNRIEFIGDSYTCGYGNEGKNHDEHFKYETENNYMTFGAIAARALNAEYFMICRSGIGMFQGYGGGRDFNMPKYYDDVILNSELKWDYMRYQPQVVVIDLAGNDLSAKLDDAAFIKAYTDFLIRLRKNYSYARLICIAGPSAPGDEWERWRALIHTVVNQSRAWDPLIFYFEFSTFEPNGSDWHPNVMQHKSMADELTAFLAALMGW